MLKSLTVERTTRVHTNDRIKTAPDGLCTADWCATGTAVLNVLNISARDVKPAWRPLNGMFQALSYKCNLEPSKFVA